MLVDRGWVAAGPRRAELPPAPPPAGTVTVDGRVNVPPARYLELRAERATGPVWQNLDIARIAAAQRDCRCCHSSSSRRMAPSDGLVRDWPAPDFGIEQHRSYMVQWYSFAVLGCVLWLGLNWRVRETTRWLSRSRKSKGRRTLLLLALVALAPIVASYVTYYWFVPDKRVNYGELLPAGSAPPVIGVGADGAPFALADLRGQWVLLIVTGADCTDACRAGAIRNAAGAHDPGSRAGSRGPRLAAADGSACAGDRIAGFAAGTGHRERRAGGPRATAARSRRRADDSPAGPARQSRLALWCRPGHQAPRRRIWGGCSAPRR